MKKIIVFIFLMNVFCLPYEAFTDSPCVEVLKRLDRLNEKIESLTYQNKNFAPNNDLLKIDLLSQREYNNIKLELDNMLQAGVDVHFQSEASFRQILQFAHLAPFFESAKKLTYIFLDHPKIDINSIIDYPTSYANNTLLLYSIKNLDKALHKNEVMAWTDVIKQIIESPRFNAINVRDNNGHTALSYLLKEFNYGISEGLDINAYTMVLNKIDKNTNHLLQKHLLKMEKSYIDEIIIEPIIKHPDFDPNLKFGNDKMTYLHMAREGKRRYVTKLLMEHPNHWIKIQSDGR